MYAYAPPFPASYRWLSQPLSGLSGNGWQTVLSNLSPKDLQSYYVMIPLELRNSLFRRTNTSRWMSWVAVATATVVSGAAALYYYVPWDAFDDMGSLIMPMEDDSHSMCDQENGGAVADDSDCDDYPVDEELMDGFRCGDKRKDSMFLLVSSDPKSDLCHRPIHLDFTDQTPRLERVESGPKTDMSIFNEHFGSQGNESPVTIQSPPAMDMNDPLNGVNMAGEKRSISQVSPDILSPAIRPMRFSDDSRIPSILKNDRVMWQKPQPMRQSMSAQGYRPAKLARPTPLSEGFSVQSLENSNKKDSPLLSPDGDESPLKSGAISPRTRRSIIITEPDWAPFADTNTRARTRSMIASLKEPRPKNENDPTSTPVEKDDEVNALLAPAVNDDGELWFERFMQSTAATSKRRDFRERNSANLAELSERLEQIKRAREEAAKGDRTQSV